MNDNKLLEMAAKAAGISGEWAHWHLADGDGWVEGINICGQLLWNPLTDDGDALRLAVKLELILDTHGLWVRAGLPFKEWMADEQKKHDPYAATRRAIVRAAAEIGKAMP